MAKRKSRRKRSQLGYNADAKAAIKHARKGRCDIAWRHVIDASSAYTSKADQDDAHLARVIVNQHCGKARSKRSKRHKQRFPFWGRTRKRRKSRR